MKLFKGTVESAEELLPLNKMPEVVAAARAEAEAQREADRLEADFTRIELILNPHRFGTGNYTEDDRLDAKIRQRSVEEARHQAKQRLRDASRQAFAVREEVRQRVKRALAAEERLILEELDGLLAAFEARHAGRYAAHRERSFQVLLRDDGDPLAADLRALRGRLDDQREQCAAQCGAA